MALKVFLYVTQLQFAIEIWINIYLHLFVKVNVQ